jgi:hypothetical protein
VAFSFNLDNAKSYIDRLALDGPGELRTTIESRGAEDLEALLPKYGQEDQAVAIGSQLTEFTKAVPVDIRPTISNSLLLAQLAANKATKDAGGTSAKWRDTYQGVLLNTGWTLEGMETGIQGIDKNNLEVHEAIIPVITGRQALPDFGFSPSDFDW